jgi:hypothetical protein
MVTIKTYARLLASGLLLLAASEVVAVKRDQQSGPYPFEHRPRFERFRPVSSYSDWSILSGDKDDQDDDWSYRSDAKRKKSAGAVIGKAGRELGGMAVKRAKKAKSAMQKAWDTLTDGPVVKTSWYLCSRGITLAPLVALGYVITPKDNRAAFAVATKAMAKGCALSGLVTVAGIGQKLFNSGETWGGIVANGFGITTICGSLYAAQKVLGSWS